jgi:hypothetical protein
MGQGREALPDVDAFGCLCSLRNRSALDGVSRVQSGSVEIAVGHWLAACNRIGAVVCSLPRACRQQPTAHEKAVVSMACEIKAAGVSPWCPNHESGIVAAITEGGGGMARRIKAETRPMGGFAIVLGKDVASSELAGPRSDREHRSERCISLTARRTCLAK